MYSSRVNLFQKLLNYIKYSFKIAKQLEQIDQSTLDVLNYKARCDEQEKELEKFRSQLTEKEINSNTQLSNIAAQLVDREDYLNKLHAEVYFIKGSSD